MSAQSLEVLGNIKKTYFSSLLGADGCCSGGGANEPKRLVQDTAQLSNSFIWEFNLSFC